MTPQITNNTTSTINNRLSVQVSLAGLSFLVTNQNNSKVKFFFEEHFENNLSPEELLFNIKDIISKHNDLQFNIDEVNIVYANNLYTVVPNSFFDQKKSSDYLKFNSKILATDFIAFDTIEPYQLTIVYVPFVNINNFIFEKYGSFQYFHSSTVLLESILSHEKNAFDPKIYIHVLKGSFDIIVVKTNSLELCNTHSFKTPEDFIYYILFTLEQLKLNPETTEVILCGNISEEDDNYQILYHYIRNIIFFSPEKPNLIITELGLNHQDFLLKQLL